MIDYHTHVLPGMDDGSRSVAESLDMLRKLKEQGVDTVYATSHFYRKENSADEFLLRRKEACEMLMAAMAESDGQLAQEMLMSDMTEAGGQFPQVLMGAEVYYFEGISRSENIAELAKLKLEGTDLLMLEMPTTKWTRRMIEDIIALNESGKFRVLMAHIHRYYEFFSREDYERLRRNGVIFQANCEYFSGFFARRRAVKQLNTGYIHLIGSDCHDLTRRPPNMHLVRDILYDPRCDD